MRTVTWIAWLAVARAVAAPPVPTLALEFEHGPSGEAPGKVIAPTLEGKPELVAGKFGQALKVGSVTGGLVFPTGGILSRDAGTVELWVCPVDWDDREKKFHVFFETRDQGALYLYKFWQGGLLFLSCDNVAGPYHSAVANISAWKPGEWHHLAATWSARSQDIYVDGKLAGSTAPRLPAKLGDTFFIGDREWQFPRTTHSLIDRVRIYDRCLAAEHIAAHAAGNYDLSVPLDATSSKLSYRIDRRAGKATVVFETHADTNAGAEVAFALLKPDGTSLATATAPLAAGEAQAELPVGELAVGRYRVTATVRGGGQELLKVEQPLVRPDTSFIGNGLGEPKGTAPAPWTPLQAAAGADGVTIDVWGRRYRFDGMALPVEVTTRDASVLARPARFTGMVGDRPLDWTCEAPKLTGSSPLAADVEGLARAGGVTLRTKTHTEYDGLMVVDVDIDAPAGLQRLAVDLPVRPQHALYRHRYGAKWQPDSGLLPTTAGVVDQTAYVPFGWVGDNDRGLFWFVESAEAWPNWQDPSAYQTVREGDAVVMRLNLLAPGQKPPTPWHLRLGLQATPVRPVPQNWRRWRMAPAPRSTVEIVWPTPRDNSLAFFGYPEAKDPAKFAEVIDTIHAAGHATVPYCCLSWQWNDFPEWNWFVQEWGTGSLDPSIPEAGWQGQWEQINPLSKSYQDFLVQKTRQFQDRYKLDGFYHDQAHPYPLSPPAEGGGWRDATGTAHPRFPILAYRDLYRRIYLSSKESRPDGFTQAHMSGKVTIPFLAYEDSYLDGEHFRGVVKDTYLEVSSLAEWRTEYMGRQWGLMPFFLPEFDEEHRKTPEPTRGLMGLLLVHDVQPWPLWCHPDPVKAMYDALDAFGYIDSTFIPYFDADPPVAIATPDVVGSVYRHGDRALVVIANPGREPHRVTATLNAKRIGLPLDQVVTWPEKAPVRRQGDAVDLELPGLSYQLLLVGKAP